MLFFLPRAAGRRAATAPSSPSGKAMRTMRCRDDLPAGSRMLVRGIAARPNACWRRRVPMPQLSACQDRSAEKPSQNKRSL